MYRPYKCNICGRELHYGGWTHEIQCAKARQAKEDAKRAVGNGNKLPSLPSAVESFRTAWQELQDGKDMPIDDLWDGID